MKFICIGPNCWGTGPTKEAAMRKCAQVGPGMRVLRKHYLLFKGDDDASVEECFGGIESAHPVKLVEKKGQ